MPSLYARSSVRSTHVRVQYARATFSVPLLLVRNHDPIPVVVLTPHEFEHLVNEKDWHGELKDKKPVVGVQGKGAEDVGKYRDVEDEEVRQDREGGRNDE